MAAINAQELEALLAEVTPGEWLASRSCIMSESPMAYIATVGSPFDRGEVDAANARLIVMSKTLARKAIAAEDMAGKLAYLQRQAENGTLHPQVVIQNAREAISAWRAAQ